MQDHAGHMIRSCDKTSGPQLRSCDKTRDICNVSNIFVLFFKDRNLTWTNEHSVKSDLKNSAFHTYWYEVLKKM